MLATEVRSGDAPKPLISIKTYENLKKSRNQPQINHRNFSLFLSLPQSRRLLIPYPDSEIVMVDLGFGDDFFEQDRSWDDFGTTISGI